MRSHDLPTAPYAFACWVTIIPKTKRCGKANCGDCPHGPYWYARAPHTATRYGDRLDLYLGSYWTDATVLEKVAPRLSPAVGAALEREIAGIRDREKLVELERSVTYQVQQLRQMRADFDRMFAQQQRQLLNTRAERDTLLAKLNPPKPKKAKAHA